MSIFGERLYRTPYLVLPRLALESMPEGWQERFEALLKEADEAGIKTPAYFVFRDVTNGNPDQIRGVKLMNPSSHMQRPFYQITGGYNDDPWSDYRHGNAKALSK